MPPRCSEWAKRTLYQDSAGSIPDKNEAQALERAVMAIVPGRTSTLRPA